MILLIDDNADLALAFQIILQSRGMETVVKHSAQEAFEFLKISKEIPELILLDYSMPIMNGGEFLRSVRKNLPHILTHSKVVGISSLAIRDFVTDDFRDTVAEFVEKPCDIQSLVSLVQKHLS